MDYSIFVRLVLAHLLSDFIFQPTSWAKDKDTKGFESKKLYWHTLVTCLTAILLIWDVSWIIPILIITAIHGITDGIKGEVNKRMLGAQYPGPGYLLLIDQIIHFLTIIVTWIVVTNQADALWTEITALLKTQDSWYVLVGYTLVSMPISVVIGKMTQKWNHELNGQNSTTTNPSSNTNGTQGLENAGKWIGIVERTLILTFVLIHQFGAIGFLLAAKSVFRFGDLKDSNDQKKTEYIIIGTLLSFMLAIFTGITINHLLK